MLAQSLRTRASCGMLSRVASVQARGLASDAELRRTPLYDLNVELGGTMVEFGGWAMPVKYPGKEGGIMATHMHTREQAGLFDVSHMLPLRFYGKDRAKFMETVLCGDIQELEENMGTLSLITNDQGGIIDDCICTNAGDHIYTVINAGHEDKDIPHIEAHLADFKAKGGDVSMEVCGGGGLMALQGPTAINVMSRLAPEVDWSQMKFMSGHNMRVGGMDCFVTRSGYTGEDGVEIGTSAENAEAMARLLLSQEEVMPVGLGARDSLRLEAGLCLYGNDLDDTTTPIEATLLWTIGKRRREEGGFPGAEIILKQRADKSAARKRVGFVSKGAPAREHALIYAEGVEEPVGEVTSGVMSPCLKKPIGMAYVATKYAKAGTELQVKVRNKRQPLTTSKMPFTPANYFRGA